MKPGPKPKGKVVLGWSPQFAYAVGLLAADGCLSKDGRHIEFTSKDRDLVLLFRKCLGITTVVSPKLSGAGNISYHTQFGDVLFYKFLQEIGLSPAKSKTISRVEIPPQLFADFLRGYFDGDGCSYSYMDPAFPNSFRFYISFISASPAFLIWLRAEIEKHTKLHGAIDNGRYPQLKYAKREAAILAEFLYGSADTPRLRRKYLKIKRSMRIIEGRRSGEIGRRAAFRAQ